MPGNEPYDEVIVWCVRVGDPKAMPVLGAEKRRCADCGGEIWVAPTSLKVLAQAPNAVVVCTPCGRARMRREPGNTYLAPMSAEQAREIKETLDVHRRRN